MPADVDALNPITAMTPEVVATALGDKVVRWLVGLQRRMDAAEAHAEAAEARAEAAEARAEAAEARAGHLEGELSAARASIAELEETNRQLRARLGKDSSNSSRPPSSDGPQTEPKRKQKAQKKKRSGRPAGGQPGHEGRTRLLRPVEEADRVFHHHPDHCEHCDDALDEAPEAGEPLPHQQYELPPLKLWLFHHWLHRKSCPRCMTVTTARLPPWAVTGQGPRLTGFIGLLTGHYQLSRSKVRGLVHDLFGLEIATGTVQACWERVGEALLLPVEELVDALRKATSAFLDETGWKQWGKRCWLWVATTAMFAVFMIHPRRGAEVLHKWFPEGFGGTVHSDRWVAYSFFDTEKRQLCWSHLGRDLQGIIDSKGAGADQAEVMRRGEAWMFGAWHEHKGGRMSRAELQATTAYFREAFREYCEIGAAQKYDDDWRKLGTSMLKLWPAVFRFLDVEGLQPTNNFAEQEVRKGVLWRRSSQGTRSETGSDCVSRMLSIDATCRKQGMDVLEYLTAALMASWSGIPPPSPLAARK
jgi:transposase